MKKKKQQSDFIHATNIYCLPAMHECSITQSCPTLCDPMDCSLLGSSIRRIFEARMLEWSAISFSSVGPGTG